LSKSPERLLVAVEDASLPNVPAHIKLVELALPLTVNKFHEKDVLQNCA